MTPELSRPLEIHSLPLSGRDFALTTTAEERARVAERLGLQEMPMLSAQLLVQAVAGGVKVTGTFGADVVQNCVVTLVPIASHLSGDVSVTLLAEQDEPAEEIEIGLDGDDVELLQGDIVDVGEIVVEQLALVIDPYPRVPGAVFSAPKSEESRDESPFSALAKLKSIRKTK
jgi:uncharacterized metal-binding protein YceD (DUF177 family)